MRRAVAQWPVVPAAARPPRPAPRLLAGATWVPGAAGASAVSERGRHRAGQLLQAGLRPSPAPGPRHPWDTVGKGTSLCPAPRRPPGSPQTRWGDNGTGPAGPCAPRLVTPHPPPAQRRLSPPVARFRLRGDAHRAHRDPVPRGGARSFICKVLIPSLGLPFPSVSHAWGSLTPLLALRVTSSRGAPPFPEPLVASLSGAVRPRALGCLPQPLGNVTGTQPQAWPSPVPAPGLAVCSAGTSSPWGPPSSATERPGVGCSPCLGPEPLPCTS